MKRMLLGLPILFLALPAHATGGFTCRTSGPKPVMVSIAFGHAAGSPLLRDAIQLHDNGRNVAVAAPQWWLDDKELRILLADRSILHNEAIIKTKRNGRSYDGTLQRGGKLRWVRCLES